MPAFLSIALSLSLFSTEIVPTNTGMPWSCFSLIHLTIALNLPNSVAYNKSG